METKRVALVSGANKGIGYQVVRDLAERDFKVILTARNPEKGMKAAGALHQEGLDVHFHLMDVTDQMKKNHYGRIVNISSGLGTLDDMGGGYPSYRVSKTALNALTKILAAETAGTGILVNSMCPGWVRTDMGGANADRSVEEGADTAIFLATLPDGGPSGKYFRDRKQIKW